MSDKIIIQCIVVILKVSKLDEKVFFYFIIFCSCSLLILVLYFIYFFLMIHLFNAIFFKHLFPFFFFCTFLSKNINVDHLMRSPILWCSGVHYHLNTYLKFASYYIVLEQTEDSKNTQIHTQIQNTDT